LKYHIFYQKIKKRPHSCSSWFARFY